jgi:hypothetical protein
VSDLNFDPRPPERRPPRRTFGMTTLMSIVWAWLMGVGITGIVMYLRFNDLDDEAGAFAPTDKIITAIFGCTAILVLTVGAAIGVYINRDKLELRA